MIVSPMPAGDLIDVASPSGTAVDGTTLATFGKMLSDLAGGPPQLATEVTIETSGTGAAAEALAGDDTTDAAVDGLEQPGESLESPLLLATDPAVVVNMVQAGPSQTPARGVTELTLPMLEAFHAENGQSAEGMVVDATPVTPVLTDGPLPEGASAQELLSTPTGALIVNEASSTSRSAKATSGAEAILGVPAQAAAADQAVAAGLSQRAGHTPTAPTTTTSSTAPTETAASQGAATSPGAHPASPNESAPPHRDAQSPMSAGAESAARVESPPVQRVTAGNPAAEPQGDAESTELQPGSPARAGEALETDNDSQPEMVELPEVAPTGPGRHGTERPGSTTPRPDSGAVPLATGSPAQAATTEAAAPALSNGATVVAATSNGAVSDTAPSAPMQPSALPAAVAQQTQTAQRAADGQHRAIVRLDPPELGNVVIEVSALGDDVAVIARTESPEAMRALMRQRADMAMAIESLGMSLSGFDVQTGSDSDAPEKQEGSGSRTRRDGTSSDPNDQEQRFDQPETPVSEGDIFL